VGVVVSMASVSERKATPRAFRSSKRSIRSCSDRLSRSSFQTVSVSPAASALRHWVSSGRLTSAPAATLLERSRDPYPARLKVAAAIVETIAAARDEVLTDKQLSR